MNVFSQVSAVLLLAVVACTGQDQLTCSRTSDTFNIPGTSGGSNPDVPAPQRGYPGKRGSVGPVGPDGLKGQKGEVGVSDSSHIDRLQDQIATMATQLQRLEDRLDNQTRDCQRRINALSGLQDAVAGNTNLAQSIQIETDAIRKGLVFPPASGWFTVYNGYQYKYLEELHTWEDSRRECQGLGGDLAVFGIKGYKIRRIIGAHIGHTVWVGLSDLVQEGVWKWVDGSDSTRNNTRWWTGEPNGGTWESCGQMFVASHEFRMNDAACSTTLPALCEKM